MVARIGSQVAGALAAGHEAGIVHRNLKPGNILLTEDGTAKITDFGISGALGDVSVSQTGGIAGIPAYLAPETAVGGDPTPASDVFSLGSTLYAAAEGRPPFGIDDDSLSLLRRVASGQVEPPRNAGPMTDVLTELLRVDPEDRPTMAQAHVILQSVPTQTTAAEHRAPEDSGDTNVPVPISHTPFDAVDVVPALGRRAPKLRRLALLGSGASVMAILIGVLTTGHATDPPAVDNGPGGTRTAPRTTVPSQGFDATRDAAPSPVPTPSVDDRRGASPAP